MNFTNWLNTPNPVQLELRVVVSMFFFWANRTVVSLVVSGSPLWDRQHIISILPLTMGTHPKPSFLGVITHILGFKPFIFHGFGGPRVYTTYSPCQFRGLIYMMLRIPPPWGLVHLSTPRSWLISWHHPSLRWVGAARFFPAGHVVCCLLRVWKKTQRPGVPEKKI